MDRVINRRKIMEKAESADNDQKEQTYLGNMNLNHELDKRQAKIKTTKI